jgi:hypothetical protein
MEISKELERYRNQIIENCALILDIRAAEQDTEWAEFLLREYKTGPGSTNLSPITRGHAEMIRRTKT